MGSKESTRFNKEGFMAIDKEKENEPGDELEDLGEEISSDYREEEEESAGDEGEELEEEVSYESEGTKCASQPSSPTAAPSAPAPQPRRAAAARKPARKAATARSR